VVGSDGEGAIALAERGLACGASGALRGALFLQASRGHAYLGDMVACLGRARSALELLPPGSADWLQATANLVVASLHVGDPAGIVEVLQATSALQTEPEPTGAHGFVGFSLVMSLLNVGQQELGLAVFDRLLGVAARAAPPVDPTFDGYVALSHLIVDILTRGDLGDAIRRSHVALDLMGDSGDSLAAFVSRQYAGWVRIEVGDFEHAIELETPLLTASGGTMKLAREWGTVWTGKALAQLGRSAPAVDLLAPLAATASPAVADSARAFLAEGHLVAGAVDDAAREARKVVEESMMRSPRTVGLSILARIELAAGRPREALAHADRGIAAFAGSQAARLELSTLHLARVDALRALGDDAAATAALEEARARVERIAATLDDAELRRTYEALPVHERTLGAP
jgi:tetratricopeptide (TPR) repeat protein